LNISQHQHDTYFHNNVNAYTDTFSVQKAGLWRQKSRHPTPTPGNFDYPTPTPDRLRPSAVLVT